MPYRFSLFFLVLSAAACGGSVTGATNGAGGRDGFPGSGGTGGVSVVDGGPDVQPGAGGDANTGVDATKDADSGYVDPGCPDAAPPPIKQECNLFAKPGTCPGGEACYPFVQYPSGPCQQEQYGTMCQPQGSGHQGDPCAGGDCASGFVCVLTGAGNQCIRLCHLTGPNDCPSGLVCEAIDSNGYGGCD